MNQDPVYLNYWKRKQLLERGTPGFPLLKWWPDAALSEVESVCFDAIREAGSLLDIGAGNLAHQKKFREAGFRGDYDTVDTGSEFQYTYKDLAEVRKQYPAILCMDVLEHLSLRDGLEMLGTLISRLTPGGILVLQTPNARCTRSAVSKDMTHLHSYNLPDLYAYLSCLGFSVRGYRVHFTASRYPGVGARILSVLGAWITVRLLGSDYADNILLVAKKGGSPNP